GARPRFRTSQRGGTPPAWGSLARRYAVERANNPRLILGTRGFACESEQVPNRETSLTAEHLSRRRAATAAAWNLTDEFAVVGASSDAHLEDDLRYAFTDVRRAKDDVELARMRTAEEATRSGYLLLDELIAEERTERQIQIDLEAQFFRGGADFLAFDTIVAGGRHSAVLHFAPTTRPLATGELVLVDAGGEYRGYAS